MSFTRNARRMGIAAVSVSALVALAACGGGNSGGSPSATGGGGASASADPEYNNHGPITMVQGKDTSGNVQNEIDAWNKEHPDEKVTLIELPDNADQQRAQMIQKAQIKSSEFSIVSVDVVWTAEFAANGYIDQLDESKFPLDGFLPPTVESAKYFNHLYSYPVTSDGGLLYYRKDWLDEAGVQPPKTMDEMKQACQTIKDKVAEAKKADCFAGQYQKYEGLTVNISEAVDSAGGHITDDAGKPTVNTPEAVKGLTWMVDAFKDGTIPKGAITWQEEQGRQAFQDGKLIFHRNWPYVWSLAEKSAIKGKFMVAPLPGVSGPGVSSLGGHNWAISKFAKNKGTAVDFINWLGSEKQMIARTKATSNAPTRESLYSDAELTKQFPYLPILLESIKTARPRPKAVKYGDVTLAIQDSTYSAIQGDKAPDAAFQELQTKLEGLIK